MSDETNPYDLPISDDHSWRVPRTVASAAEALGTDEGTIVRWIGLGRFPHARFEDGQWALHGQDIAELRDTSEQARRANGSPPPTSFEARHGDPFADLDL